MNDPLSSAASLELWTASPPLVSISSWYSFNEARMSDFPDFAMARARFNESLMAVLPPFPTFDYVSIFIAYSKN